MRVLRERDEMQSILDKYERHLSEIQANIRVLTAERDKIKMRYQQVEHIELNSHLPSFSWFYYRHYNSTFFSKSGNILIRIYRLYFV